MLRLDSRIQYARGACPHEIYPPHARGPSVAELNGLPVASYGRSAGERQGREHGEASSRWTRPSDCHTLLRDWLRVVFGIVLWNGGVSGVYLSGGAAVHEGTTAAGGSPY